ncbi:hypothetical protein [Flavobacterium sp. UBA6031]|uniref:hypothetical protein n=1 Tax=Flavobacterium sp. UBA6031 TaxID=1946551 RepID=UPI0025B9063B|nr:hypothetical protein [Flavobacterium sp. UBA6031]
MIKRNDALNVFEMNLERTNMLIQAAEKIGGYNYLYQDKAFDVDIAYGKIVRTIQNEELEKISISCFEHAIISIATAFETYLKELIQELLFKNGDYFLKQDTIWKETIKALIKESEIYDCEVILNRLELYNRFKIISFLSKHNISLLTQDQDNFIKAIYIKRNNFVHNGSVLSEKTKLQIIELKKTDTNQYINQSIKHTRTKFRKMILKIHENALLSIENYKTITDTLQ